MTKSSPAAYTSVMKPEDQAMIDAYLEHLRRAQRTDETLRGRREILCRLNSKLTYGLGETDDEELAAWLYRDDLKQNTKFTYYMCLRSFYGWATDPRDPWLTHDPTDGLEPVTAPKGIARPVTDEQLRRILTESAEPYLTYAKLAAYSGLRCIEISRLDREHVTEQQLIVVKGKGGRPRVHDTDPYVWAAIEGLPRGPVALVDGRRATAFEVSAHTALYFRRKLKLPGVGLHMLRHWLGVNIQERYKDIRVTQEALGHASISSTQIYTRATAEQLRQARAMLPRLAG
ncbi:MAG: integrase family protein [Nocardioides sp.]|nr:integrase family protein [Nocardioides sp.]